MRNFWRKPAKEKTGLDRTGRVPETAPPLDFTMIPVVEAAGLLRFIGSRLVEDLLDVRAAPGRRAPDIIGFMLAAPSFDSLRELLAADPRSSLSAGALAPSPTSYDRSAPSGEDFPALIARLMDGGLQLDQFELSERRQLLNMLGVTQYPLLPEIFWPLAGITAWMDLNYQYEVAYTARRFLLSKVLFFANDATEPVFSPEVFWALVAQTNANAIPTQAPQTVPPTWLYEVAHSLRNTALKLALQADWAGVWDRWLIAQSFIAWQPSSDEHRRELQKVFPVAQQVGEWYPSVVQQFDVTDQIWLEDEVISETYHKQEALPSVEGSLLKDDSLDIQHIEHFADEKTFPHSSALQESISDETVEIDRFSPHTTSDDTPPSREIVVDIGSVLLPKVLGEPVSKGSDGDIHTGSSGFAFTDVVDILVNGSRLALPVATLSKKTPVRITLKSKVDGQTLPLSRYECRAGPELDTWVGVKLESAGWTVYLKKHFSIDLEGFLKIYTTEPIQSEIASIKLHIKGAK